MIYLVGYRSRIQIDRLKARDLYPAVLEWYRHPTQVGGTVSGKDGFLFRFHRHLGTKNPCKEKKRYHISYKSYKCKNKGKLAFVRHIFFDKYE